MVATRIQGMRSEFAWRANAGGYDEPHTHGEENPRSQWRKLALVVARRESVRPNKQDIGGLTQCCSLSQITPSFPRRHSRYTGGNPSPLVWGTQKLDSRLRGNDEIVTWIPA